VIQSKINEGINENTMQVPNIITMLKFLITATLINIFRLIFEMELFFIDSMSNYCLLLSTCF